MLTEERMKHRNSVLTFFIKFREQRDYFMRYIVTVDKTWMSHNP